MRKSTQNTIVDSLLLTSFLFLTSTGFLLFFVLPAGTNKSYTLAGLSRHDWGEIHLVIAFTVLVLAVLHLLLHFPWLKATFLGRKGSSISPRTLVIGLVSVMIVAVAIAPYLLPLEKRDSRIAHSGKGRGQKHMLHNSAE